MSLRFGRRKALAVLAVGVVAAVSVAAWLLFGTDGLLAVLIVNSVAAPLVLGWLLAQVERRTRVVTSKLRVALESLEGHPKLDELTARLEELSSQADWNGEQADRLLTALNARLTRTELLQEQFLDALGQSLEVAEANQGETHDDPRAPDEHGSRPRG